MAKRTLVTLPGAGITAGRAEGLGKFSKIK